MQRMTIDQRAGLGEWLAAAKRRLEAQREWDGTSPAKLCVLAEEALGRTVTRSHLVTAAGDRGIELPKGKPGRPRTRDKQSPTTEGTAALATEVRRLCRVLEIEPVDPAALDRIAAGA